MIRPVDPIEWIITPEPIAGSAADDQAFSRAVLERVAMGRIAGAVRIWRPRPGLALTRLDRHSPGAAAAVALAERAGVEIVVRESGGHAVVTGGGSLAVGVAEPAATFEGTTERYRRLGDALVGALRAVGVAAEQGGLEGEWCPGPWSIRAGGVKLAGLAQRARKGGAWVEAIVELEADTAARDLLQQVYAALDLPLDPRTFGSVAEVAGRVVTFEELAAALAAHLRGAWRLPPVGS
jgi:octanoyl-[GcvH]:protein N-octanoyltransferase